MYKEFYGFSEDPFNLTPDPSFLFCPPGYEEVRSSIIRAIRERKGILVVTGEVGAGKTTLINALRLDLSDKVNTAYILNPRLTFKQLFESVLAELKIPAPGGGSSSLQRKFHEYLQEKAATNETVLIIIDEAQHLTPKVFEGLGRLYDQIPSGANGPQTLLVGQLELGARLNSEELRHFKPRVAIQRQINLLNFQESRDYIDHRLRVVGSSSSKVFTPEAIEVICKYAKGTPRVINVVCDEALFSGYALSAPIINGQMVREVIADIAMTIQKKTLGEVEIVVRREMAAAQELSGETFGSAEEQVISEKEDFVQKESRVGEKGSRTEGEAVVEKVAISTQEATEGPLYPRIPQGGYIHRESAFNIRNGIPVLVLLALVLVSGLVYWHENRVSPLIEGNKSLSLEQGRTEEVEGERIKIENGWTLSTISKRFYGAVNPSLIDLILAANPQITDLNRIKVGDSIIIPKVSERLLLIEAGDHTLKIHLATFMDREQARIFRDEPILRRREFEVVPRKVSPRETWYRVLAGPFATREEALQSIQALKEKGLLPFSLPARKES